MYRASILLFPLLVSSIAAHASSIANIGAVSCSGNQTSSLIEAASFQCSGDFSVSDGSITSDLKIAISADGSLLLENLSLTAPIVELTGLNGVLLIGGRVSLNANSVLLGVPPSIAKTGTLSVLGSGGDIVINAGSEISLSNGTNVGSSVSTSNVGGSVILNYGGGELISPAEAGVIGLNVIIPPNGGVITSIAAVPAPSSYLSMVFGLVALIGSRFSRRAGACEPIQGRLFS